MTRMWRCPYCGELNDDDADFCEYCGRSIVPDEFLDDDEDCLWGEEYCEDGIPDVNQGWVGENYG